MMNDRNRAALAAMNTVQLKSEKEMLDKLRTHSLLASIEVRKARTLITALFESNRLDGIGDDIELPIAMVQECLDKAIATFMEGAV